MKKKGSITGGHISIQRLLDNLQISEEEVHLAAAKQASLYFEASRLRTRSARLHKKAEMEAEAIRSRLVLSVRDSLLAKGERPTDSLVKAHLTLVPEYQEAMKRVRLAEEKAEASKLLLEAYRHRRDALKIYLEQNRAEVGHLRNPMPPAIRKRLQAKYPGRV